jgi:hypothetical protein
MAEVVGHVVFGIGIVGEVEHTEFWLAMTSSSQQYSQRLFFEVRNKVGRYLIRKDQKDVERSGEESCKNEGDHGDDAAEQNVEALKNNADASKNDKQAFAKSKESFAYSAEVSQFNRREHWAGDRYEEKKN